MRNLKYNQQKTPDEEDARLLLFVAITLLIIIVSFFCFVAINHELQSRRQTLDFHIESISTTPINVSTSEISAGWNIYFYLRKGDGCNFSDIFYDVVEVSIYYKNVFLWKASMESIYLSDDGKWVPATANKTAKSVRLEKWAGYAIATELNRKGAVRFNVKVEARVLLDPGTEFIRNGSVSVYCKNVKAIVDIIDDKSSSDEEFVRDGPKVCDVNLTEDTSHVLPLQQ